MCSPHHLLHPTHLSDLARSWLREDTPSFDYGGFVVGDKEEDAVILAKGAGILAGRPFVDAVFKELGCTVKWNVTEGTPVQPKMEVAYVHGKACHLLLGERVALNCMCRASGIATQARRLKLIKETVGWHGEVAGTRKTTPGFRQVEKYSLLVGGISTHRNDLSSMVMLKDNHIWTAGNITQAVSDARSICGFSSKIEVECRSLQEASEAANAGADIVMLDNFDPEALHKTAFELKKIHPKLLIEASGGVTEVSLSNFMGPNIDVISLSCTTQGYEVVNFSMKILKEGRDPLNPTVKLGLD